jgi:hypothetical protein
LYVLQGRHSLSFFDVNLFLPWFLLSSLLIWFRACPFCPNTTMTQGVKWRTEIHRVYKTYSIHQKGRDGSVLYKRNELINMY